MAADLLGYHLDLVDDEARARVEAAFGNAETLASARAHLTKILAPLDADDAPPPPELVAHVLERVREAKNILPMPRPRSTPRMPVPPADVDRPARGGPPLSMRDLVGLAAAILIFVGIFVPGYQTARRAVQQTVCANNLRQTGNGYAGYAEANSGYSPYAGAVPSGASWSLTIRPGVPRMRNSQHIWRLIRGRFVRPEAFICPGREEDFPVQTDSPEAFDDFPDPRNNSYSTDLVTRPRYRGEFDPAAPVVAEMTPLVDQRRRLLPQDKASLNSDSHGRSRGQNVLSANLSVRFTKTPNVGVDHDDIYRLIGVQQYTGLERPRARNDAFLIP